MDDGVEEILAEDSNGHFNPTLEHQTSFIQQVGAFLIDNGWYLLLGIIGLYIIWEKMIRKKWSKWKQEYNDRQTSAQYHKDPDMALARLQAMEESRKKMQEEYDRASALYVEKLKEREELKRQEKIKEWEKHSKGSGYHSKTKPEVPDVVPHSATSSSRNTPRFRNTDYNPLMGAGGGNSFRPSRMGRNSGGG